MSVELIGLSINGFHYRLTWRGMVWFSRWDHMMHSALSSSAMMMVDTRRRRLTVCSIFCIV